MSKNMKFLAGAACFLGLGTAFTNSATAYSDPISADQALIEFIDSNASDLAAIDSKSLELSGEHYWVQLPGVAHDLT